MNCSWFLPSSSDVPAQRHYVEHSVNAATINTAGYQRTLCLQIAMFCLRLIGEPNATERHRLRQKLRSQSEAMRRAHQGLLYGDAKLELPGYLSAALRHLYFEPPLQADAQIRQYLSAVETLTGLPDAAITRQHPQLQQIQAAAEGPLLKALDTIVAQYQYESDLEQAASINHQKTLYQQSCEAAAQAWEKSRELEQALQELTQAQAQMIQGEKMSSLGHLVAGMAHEINNPINFIHGNLSHIEEYAHTLLQVIQQLEANSSQLPAPLQEVLTAADLGFIEVDLPKILASMRLGTTRIREIVLSLSRFAHADESEVKAVNIHDAIENTLVILGNRLKPCAHRPAIQVSRGYGDLPPIECYAGQLNQVFMNLLANAIDAFEEQDDLRWSKTGLQPSPSAIPAHLPHIRIRTALVTSQAIEIIIADNGPGIDPEHMQHIFNPFFTTKPVGKGTGMGLAISYNIITQKHGGTLDCISTLGQGTQFIIRIPRALSLSAST